MSEVKTDSVVNVSGDNDSGIDLSTNDVVAIKTADTERVRVDASGNVGIGTTNPDVTSDGNANRTYVAIQGNGNRGYLNIGTPSTAGADVATVLFNNGANAIAYLSVDSDSGSTTNGHLGIGTSGTERMRIDSSGHIQVGQNSTLNPGQGNNTFGSCLLSSGRLFLSADGTYSLGLNRSDSGELTNFSRAGAFKGSISITASQVNYNQTSDYRLKENVSDMTGAITRLKTLQPKRFNFIADPDDTTVDGFLAHEVTAVPEAVTGTHNATDSDNNPIYQQIDQSKLVPLLTGALQEAIAKIETLETKVAALEAGE